jgi:hypothetical protein
MDFLSFYLLVGVFALIAGYPDVALKEMSDWNAPQLRKNLLSILLTLVAWPVICVIFWYRLLK